MDLGIHWVAEHGPNFYYIDPTATTRETRVVAVIELDRSLYDWNANIIGGEYLAVSSAVLPDEPGPAKLQPAGVGGSALAGRMLRTTRIDLLPAAGRHGRVSIAASLLKARKDPQPAKPSLKPSQRPALESR